MIGYLRWSLWQLYLLYFRPIRFEIMQMTLGILERFLYLLKLSPLVFAILISLNCLCMYLARSFGVNYRWESTAGVFLVFLIGILFGGVFLDVRNSIALWLSLGIGLPIAIELDNGLGSGTIGAIAYGFAYGGAMGVGFAIATDLMSNRIVRNLGFMIFMAVFVGGVGAMSKGMEGGVASALACTVAYFLVYFRIISYPFDITLATITFLIGRHFPSSLPRTWQCYPLAWNEVIWLPLPYAAKMLVLLVQQNREEGFRQIAYVAAERPLQRRAVQAALVEVALTDLNGRSLTELAAIADKLRWTTEPVVALPDEITATLPRFDRVAQILNQSIILHSPQRRLDSLDSALKELDSLRKTLIAAQGRMTPRLLHIANEWHRIVLSEYEAIHAVVEQSCEIPNKYLLGTPVREDNANLFMGRHDIVRQIEQHILGASQAPTLLLHGPRRMGKTSILNQLPRLLGPDFAPALLDCQEPGVIESEATLLRTLSQAISAGLQNRRVYVKPLRRDDLRAEPFAVFRDWIDDAERAMPDSLRALLCLDEYESLQYTLDNGWGGRVLDMLRHLLQHRRKMVLLFTGAHTFEEMGHDWTHRFLSARRVRVSFLGRADLVPLLTKPIPEFDMTYAPGALEALLDVTNGHPLLTQVVASELVELLNEQQRKQARPDDIDVAVTRGLARSSDYFANVWNDAGAAGQAVLLALVRGQALPEHPRAGIWLRDHDVVAVEDARPMRFLVPMVERWVRQKSADSA